jgi:hypothetical protein
MTGNGLYIGECKLFSKNYEGDAVNISMQGCNISTTHIQMVLTPNEQKQLVDWFCEHRKQMVEDALK